MTVIIVGEGDHRYAVDASTCAHTTEGVHHCVHDWRIVFGNVEQTGTGGE